MFRKTTRPFVLFVILVFAAGLSTLAADKMPLEKAGTIGLVAPNELCVELAANILGMDSEDADDNYTYDAIKELTNILCGQFITSLFGEDMIFDLSPPSVEAINRERWNRLISDEKTTGFVIDDLPALIYTSMDG